jgi:hypothetical protein
MYVHRIKVRSDFVHRLSDVCTQLEPTVKDVDRSDLAMPSN